MATFKYCCDGMKLNAGAMTYTASVARMVWWRSLQRVISIGKKRSILDTERYARFLHCIDRGLSLDALENSKFVGHGFGAWNLHAYRVGDFKGRSVFEKVYLLNSDSWNKMMWVHREVLPEIEPPIKTPRLLHSERGKRLAVAYFDFIEGAAPIKRFELLPKVVAFQGLVSDFRWEGSDSAISDFRRESVYFNGRERLRRVLLDCGEDVHQISIIEGVFLRPSMLRVFAHGDMAPANFTLCGNILDFDRAGYYPVGFDCGWVLGRWYRRASVAEIEELLKRFFFSDDTFVHYSILFFMIIFHCHQKRENINVDLVRYFFRRVVCGLNLVDHKSSETRVTSDSELPI